MPLATTRSEHVPPSGHEARRAAAAGDDAGEMLSPSSRRCRQASASSSRRLCFRARRVSENAKRLCLFSAIARLALLISAGAGIFKWGISRFAGRRRILNSRHASLKSRWTLTMRADYAASIGGLRHGRRKPGMSGIVSSISTPAATLARNAGASNPCHHRRRDAAKTGKSQTARSARRELLPYRARPARKASKSLNRCVPR